MKENQENSAKEQEDAPHDATSTLSIPKASSFSSKKHHPNIKSYHGDLPSSGGDNNVLSIETPSKKNNVKEKVTSKKTGPQSTLAEIILKKKPRQRIRKKKTDRNNLVDSPKKQDTSNKPTYSQIIEFLQKSNKRDTYIENRGENMPGRTQRTKGAKKTAITNEDQFTIFSSIYYKQKRYFSLRALEMNTFQKMAVYHDKYPLLGFRKFILRILG